MENSSAKPITDPKVVCLYQCTRGESPNLDSFLAHGILIGGAHRMTSDRFQIFFSGSDPRCEKDANLALLEPYPFQVRGPSALVVISVAIAWRFGIEFWRTASNAVLSLQRISMHAICEITHDDGNNRIAYYLHTEHH